MQMPLELEFRNLPSSPALEALVRSRVDKLERLYDRITGCRVTVEAPHRHQHQGRRFEVHVQLVVPGNVLVYSHDKGMPEHEDANTAVRDAFDAIQRQLEDHARIERGNVKAHSRPKG